MTDDKLIRQHIASLRVLADDLERQLNLPPPFKVGDIVVVRPRDHEPGCRECWDVGQMGQIRNINGLCHSVIVLGCPEWRDPNEWVHYNAEEIRHAMVPEAEAYLMRVEQDRSAKERTGSIGQARYGWERQN